MSEIKYFLAHNAGRFGGIAGQRFEIVEIIGGSAIGVFQTTDEKTIAEIGNAVASKTGVSEISVQEYEDAVKKKLHSFKDLPHSNYQPLQVRLSQVAGVVVENPVPFEDVEAAKLESVDAALSNVGKVTPPPVGEAPDNLSKNQKRRNQ